MMKAESIRRERNGRQQSRRRLLAALGASGTGLLAGCAGNTDDPGSSSATAESTTDTQRTTSSRSDTVATTDEETETTEEEPLPSNYRVHFVPGENQELRRQIPRSQLSEYQQEFGANLITESTIFSEPAEDQRRNKEIDLLALEWWHDNDYQNIQHQEGSRFVESIGTESEPGTIEHQAKNEPFMVEYPNSDGESNTYGSFDYQQFSNSSSAGEALDWVHRYLFNWQRNYNDPGPISTEDELYAATLQESLDTYTNIESHFWAFDLPEASRSTHGNGLVYDETNNEIRIMETILGPGTQTRGVEDKQHHPVVEDSNYLNEDHDAYDALWHPLRFADYHQQDTVEGHENLDFQERKFYAASMFRSMGTGFQDNDLEAGLVDSGAVLTTEYLIDITQKLSNWNENDEYYAELFEEIKNQAKVYNKLASEEDENYVMYGTVEDPNVAKVESDNLVRRIWNDQEGEYNDFEQYLEE